MARRAEETKCRSCKAPVLRGLDEDLCAFQVEVDPLPTSKAGEALARLSGRLTYGFVWRKLYRRAWWHITDPHNTDTILAEHRCGSDPLPAGPTKESRKADHGDESQCPY